MRDKMRGWLPRTLVGLFVALLGAGALSAPAQAGTPIPPKPIGGAGFSFAHSGSPDGKIHRGGPRSHTVPSRKGGITAFTFNPTRYYAGGQNTPAASKVAFAGNMYIANPPTVDTGDQSLMEMTVQASGAGYSPQYGQAIIGIGWRKYNGTVSLFAERFRNGVWGGVFDGSTDGWVDYSGAGAAPNLGSTLTTGVSKNFQWIYDTNNSCNGGPGWWGYFDGGPIGCYPLTIWSTGTSPTYTFSGGQFMQTYGEVYDDDTTVASCTDMGTGILATGSGTRANATALKYAVGDWANMGSWTVVTNSSYANTLPVNVTSQGGTGANAFIGGPLAC